MTKPERDIEKFTRSAISSQSCGVSPIAWKRVSNSRFKLLVSASTYRFVPSTTSSMSVRAVPRRSSFRSSGRHRSYATPLQPPHNI